MIEREVLLDRKGEMDFPTLGVRYKVPCDIAERLIVEYGGTNIYDDGDIKIYTMEERNMLELEFLIYSNKQELEKEQMSND